MLTPMRDDTVYLILKTIDQADQGSGLDPVPFDQTDLAGLGLSPSDLLDHLDYLNQRQYIHTELSGKAYGHPTAGPDSGNSEAVGVRLVNTRGAEEAPLPQLIAFKRAELTDQGRQLLADLEANPPQGRSKGAQAPIPDQHMAFLKQVQLKGHLTDIYDARDITEVVFRVMRDVMTTQEADRIEAELHEPALDTDEKALQMEVADLWHDTNPIVGFLSRLRPPLQGQAPFGIDSDLFLRRVDTEASVPPTSNGEIVTAAVFSATKAELSAERIQAIADWLPAGKVRALWQAA